MRLSSSTLWVFLLPVVVTTTPPPQHIFDSSSHASSFRRPTVHESAIQARRLLQLSSIATFSTVYPSSHPPHASVAGAPVGLTEYYASCWPRPSDPTILAVGLATAVRNAAAGSNVSLGLRWHPPAERPAVDDEYAYVPANMPRVALLGHVERVDEDEVGRHNVSGCFFDKHEDAKLWAPGTDIHESWWARLVVDEVYWFGGFGDRAYIGWIPVDMWRHVTGKEVEECRLVGEKGYKPPEMETDE